MLRELAVRFCYGLASGIAFILVGWWVWVGVLAWREKVGRAL